MKLQISVTLYVLAQNGVHCAMQHAPALYSSTSSIHSDPGMELQSSTFAQNCQPILSSSAISGSITRSECTAVLGSPCTLPTASLRSDASKVESGVDTGIGRRAALLGKLASLMPTLSHRIVLSSGFPTPSSKAPAASASATLPSSVVTVSSSNAVGPSNRVPYPAISFARSHRTATPVTAITSRASGTKTTTSRPAEKTVAAYPYRGADNNQTKDDTRLDDKDVKLNSTEPKDSTPNVEFLVYLGYGCEGEAIHYRSKAGYCSVIQEADRGYLSLCPAKGFICDIYNNIHCTSDGPGRNWAWGLTTKVALNNMTEALEALEKGGLSTEPFEAFVCVPAQRMPGSI